MKGAVWQARGFEFPIPVWSPAFRRPFSRVHRVPPKGRLKAGLHTYPVILPIGQLRRNLYFHRELYGETDNTGRAGLFDAGRMGVARGDLAGLAASPHRLAGQARHHPMGVWGNCAEDRAGRNRPNTG